jgi:hypothetical protein
MGLELSVGPFKIAPILHLNSVCAEIRVESMFEHAVVRHRATHDPTDPSEGATPGHEALVGVRRAKQKLFGPRFGDQIKSIFEIR